MLSSATSAFQLQFQNIFIVCLTVAHFHLDCCSVFTILWNLGFKMRIFGAFPELLIFVTTDFNYCLSFT